MKKQTILTILSLLILITGCNASQQEAALSGKTMGTTYHIKVIAGRFDDLTQLQKKIDIRLDEINQSMSVYRKDSEISKFNSLAADTPLPVSRDFLQVLQIAKNIHEQSEGAWDGTVGPLVDLWGFGKTGNPKHIPSQDAIRQMQQQIGFQHIRIHPDNTISKTRDSISLDLGSIAKGYGVDQIAERIQQEGFRNYLVEIGGEVFAAGHRLDGQQWRIGINKPEKNSPYTEVYKVVALENKALATSGDYRNFFEQDGKMYSHVIDPTTGFPVSNRVVSVSILADSCTYADGLATAVMVMGPHKGLKRINQLPRVEGLIITMAPDGSLTDHFSNGFPTAP
jgi:thiamine biosynthesis lipoprotein